MKNKCQCTVKQCASCRNGTGGPCQCTVKECGHCKSIRASQYGTCSCHPR